MNVERDSQRSKVYAAEAFVRTLFDRAAEHGSTSMDFFGTQLTLPPEAKFGSLGAVQRYVDEVLAMPTVRRQWGDPAPLRVRARRSSTAAHYENRSGTAIIAVPDQRDADWAMRELVVLHEIAHHLCHAQPAHGPQYVTTLCTLAELVMGPEAGHVLRVVCAKEGVR